MGLSRQEYWSGRPGPSPGDLPHPGIEPASLEVQANMLALQSLPEVKTDTGVAPSAHHRPHCQVMCLKPQLTKTYQAGQDSPGSQRRPPRSGRQGPDLSLGQKTEA